MLAAASDLHTWLVGPALMVAVNESLLPPPQADITKVIVRITKNLVRLIIAGEIKNVNLLDKKL
jgi:hypothetical protein